MRQKLSPEDNRRAWLWAALIVLMMLVLGAGIFLLANHDWSPTPSLPEADAALLEASQGLDSIRITADLDPISQVLTVTQDMTLRNRTGQAQSAVVLRSWTGAYLSEDTSPVATDELYYECYGAAFNPGGLTLSRTRVEGMPVIWRWLDDAQTVLSLPATWDAEDEVSVTLEYTVLIPDCASRFGYADGVFMLGNVFPVPAVWEGGAWRTDAYASIGDPFMSECANWQVTLTVPEGFTAAASAYAEPIDANGQRRYDFTAQAMRDFALVISDRFTAAQGMAGDTLVTAWARRKSDAQAMLKYARQALESYGSRWGAYAYPAFTLAESIFPYGGMEYPGLVMIAADAIAYGSDTLEYTVAHEAAHQWWSVMVGSDSYNQPWQDESLCEYALMDYIGDVYGASARAGAAFDRIETSLRITIPRGVTPGSPIDYFADLTEYSQVVYQRGAALWMALETHLDKDALDALLRDYQSQYRFRNATREDLTQLISQHSGQDMSGLMIDYLDTYMQ
ncbi:MAG: M1 family metallopeptidase [Clostridia bacterium]|nr:M1 family metallopeptidase [Clostridia bacterium]